MAKKAKGVNADPVAGMKRGVRLRGRVTRADNRATAEVGQRGIKRVSATLAGQPNATGLLPAPPEGRRGIRILAKQDARLGGMHVEADARTVTSTHTDIGTGGGFRGARIVAKSNNPQPPNQGKRVVKPPNILRGLKKR